MIAIADGGGLKKLSEESRVNVECTLFGLNYDLKAFIASCDPFIEADRK